MFKYKIHEDKFLIRPLDFPSGEVFSSLDKIKFDKEKIKELIVFLNPKSKINLSLFNKSNIEIFCVSHDIGELPDLPKLTMFRSDDYIPLSKIKKYPSLTSLRIVADELKYVEEGYLDMKNIKKIFPDLQNCAIDLRSVIYMNMPYWKLQDLIDKSHSKGNKFTFSDSMYKELNLIKNEETAKFVDVMMQKYTIENSSTKWKITKKGKTITRIPY